MKQSNAALWTIMTVLLIAVFFLSLAAGRFAIEPGAVFDILVRAAGGNAGSDMASTVVLELRLPRTLLAMLVGAGLSLSGAVYQGIFRNPLVSPDVLGVSSGAGFGAVLGILIWGTGTGTSVIAFVCGMASVGLAYYFSRSRGSVSMMSLVLSGIIISSIFSALISLVKYVADPYDKLPAITYWLMGSLGKADFDKIQIIGLPMIAAGALLLAIRWRINILSMGEQETQSMGVAVRRDRAVIILAATLVTALVVSISGIIGWVGIVIPHLARMITGPDFRRLMPVSASLGIVYLLVIDDLCRTLTALEIPIGVITGIVSIPIFIYFILRKKVRW